VPYRTVRCESSTLVAQCPVGSSVGTSKSTHSQSHLSLKHVSHPTREPTFKRKKWVLSTGILRVYLPRPCHELIGDTGSMSESGGTLGTPTVP
jgi:hypothetical protein